MSWGDAIEKVNGQLEKAKEFRYFALLASFVFFLDFSLIVFYGESLSRLSYASVSTNFQLGHVLLFFALFTFFMSFTVPLVQSLLRLLSAVMPDKFFFIFYRDQWRNIKPKDYFYLSHLERYAVRSGNSVAYEYYKSLAAEREKDIQLYYFCLALLLAVSLDAYAYTKSSNALFAWLIPFFSDNQLSLSGAFVSLSLWPLVLFCLYFGVVKGCGFSSSSTDRVFFPDHKFDDL